MRCTLRMIIYVIVSGILLYSFVSCSKSSHETTVAEISKYGNAILDSFVREIEDDGINIGDTVSVTIKGKDGTVKYSSEMPFVDELIEVDGKVQLWHDVEDASVDICIYNGNFYETYSIRVNDIVLIVRA